MILDMYRNRLTVNGSTYRERTVNAARAFANKYAPESLSYKNVKVDGKEESMLIISTDSTSEKIIRTLPGHEFSVGQIVEWHNSYWLITEKDNDDEVTTRGRIEQCNLQLTWQNKQGKIVSRWCTASKPYYSNLDENTTIITSKREFKVQLPYDEETSMLELDKRFILEYIAGEPKTYKIVSIDTITERFSREGSVTGFLVLNIEQDEYSPERDNAELGICDYFELEDPVIPVEKAHTKVPDSKITYKGSNTVKLGGSIKTFVFDIHDATDYTAVEWKIEIEPAFEEFIHLEANANLAFVRADDRAELEGVQFKLSASDPLTEASAALTVEVIA